jgi:membrane-associated phospholipid phosphatase
LIREKPEPKEIGSVPLKRAFKVWCGLLAATVLGCAISIRWLDIPIALFFIKNVNRFALLGMGLGSGILVSGEIILIIGLAITHMVRGSLPNFAKALFVSCCASLSAFVANDHVLKVVFGRLPPAVLLHRIPTHVFHFFRGGQFSSFPSGHMVMASAFALAMIRLQSRTLPILTVLLCIGASLLIVGDWHFLGDVIAGAFIGGTAGFAAGELWLEHEKGRGGAI